MVTSSLLVRILELLRWQGGALLLFAASFAWAANHWLTPRWSPSRHNLLRAQLHTLRDSLAIAVLSWLVVQALIEFDATNALISSVAFLSVVAWLHAALRIARVFVFEWLFANSEREGVPLLLVDVFTIVASAVLFGALLHEVFLIEVTSLLATSAVLSVVLGLALQDTLGQLFAGISLQLDRPFRLGDWVEVRAGADRISGQVLEVSWRATLLLAIGEELITIPNKTMAQGLVLNFSGRERPFVRGQLFRVALDADLPLVKQLLMQAARETPGIAAEPAPVPLIIETTESWVAVKMINFVTDFGSQYSIGDAFWSKALALLAAHGVKLAGPRVEVLSPTSASALR